MASGTFQTPMNTTAGSGDYSRNIIVTWSSTNTTPSTTYPGGRSTISYTIKVGSNGSSTTRYVVAGPITVTMNGETVYSVTGRIQIRKNQVLKSGSITVDHNSDGTLSVPVTIKAAIYSGSVNNTYSGNITMTRNTVYSLSASGSNVTISVNRKTSTGTGSTGTVSTGSYKLAKGDSITITATPASNYSLSSLRVNGSNITSGSSYTVTGNVSIVAETQALASTISLSATSAYIGNAITITVNKHGTSYAHSLYYSFVGESSKSTGYITSSGGTSSSVVKFTGTSVSFTVPTAFYSKIPNSTSGTCTITCRTYASTSSTTQLGSSSTASFTARTLASSARPTTSGGSPDMTCSVVDTNDSTVALTGNSSRLILNASTAKCTITVSNPTHSGATITKATMNGGTIATGTTGKSISKVSATSFAFAATDSRGYSSTYTVSPTTYPYVPVTCIPVFTRPSATGSTLRLSISGKYYCNAAGTGGGGFGGTTNTLTLSYRYKASGGSYGSWTTISDTPTYDGTDKKYSISNITVSGTFPYQDEYTFQVRAVDKLNTSTFTVDISGGVPVFDWGKRSFRVNVDSIHHRMVSELAGATSGYTSREILTPQYSYTDLLGGTSEGVPYTAYLTAWLKRVCVDYPDASYTVFRGSAHPGVRGFIECYVYDCSDLTSGLPNSSTGVFIPYNSDGKYYRFGTVGGVFHNHVIMDSAARQITLSYTSNALFSDLSGFSLYQSGANCILNINASPTNSTSTSYVTVGTIPDGSRPVAQLYQTGDQQGSTYYPYTIRINTDGSIGVYKPTASTQAFRIQIPYFANI